MTTSHPTFDFAVRAKGRNAFAIEKTHIKFISVGDFVGL
jgi:hypothetical protein